jgi:hypothetical protein
MFNKNTPISQMRQGLNNCCYSICDELNNPYGNNDLYNQCVKNCHNFSNEMILEMGKCPIDYKTKFVRPPSNLKVTNALDYIGSSDFINKCINHCRTNECIQMCKKIDYSIEKYSKTPEKPDNNENEQNKQPYEKSNIIYYVILFIIFLVIIEGML